MEYKNRKQRYGSNKPKPKFKQWRKPKTPPEPAKPCVVRYLPMDQLLDWDEVHKCLYVHGLDGPHHVFPAKNKAQTAVWHTVQKEREHGSHTDYQVEEI